MEFLEVAFINLENKHLILYLGKADIVEAIEYAVFIRSFVKKIILFGYIYHYISGDGDMFKNIFVHKGRK